METNALREKLTEYIKVADEKKVKALYTLLEDNIETDYKWYEDEAFVSELDERTRRLESGEDKGYTIEEMSEFLNERKIQRYAANVQD